MTSPSDLQAHSRETQAIVDSVDRFAEAIHLVDALVHGDGPAAPLLGHRGPTAMIPFAAAVVATLVFRLWRAPMCPRPRAAHRLEGPPHHMGVASRRGPLAHPHRLQRRHGGIGHVRGGGQFWWGPLAAQDVGGKRGLGFRSCGAPSVSPRSAAAPPSRSSPQRSPPCWRAHLSSRPTHSGCLGVPWRRAGSRGS